MRREIVQHGWEVASAEGYPWLTIVDEDLVGRPPTPRELAIAEALARALPKVLEPRRPLLAAWDGGDPVARTVEVATHLGDVEVAMLVSYGRAPRATEPRAEVASLSELDDAEDDARRSLEDALMSSFAASPEATGLTELQAGRFVMDFASTYFGATIATLEPGDLHEIVFEIIPRQVSVDASAARGMIEELRALYRYLKRVQGLEQADACLRVLDGDAVARLEDELSDPSKFGMAKSLLSLGRDAGFDMGSKAGIEAWMRALQALALPDGAPLPSLGAPRRPVDSAAARAKKNARKAARKARKKNR